MACSRSAFTDQGDGVCQLAQPLYHLEGKQDNAHQEANLLREQKEVSDGLAEARTWE